MSTIGGLTFFRVKSWEATYNNFFYGIFIPSTVGSTNSLTAKLVTVYLTSWTVLATNSNFAAAQTAAWTDLTGTRGQYGQLPWQLVDTWEATSNIDTYVIIRPSTGNVVTWPGPTYLAGCLGSTSTAHNVGSYNSWEAALAGCNTDYAGLPA
jgi:hypothetical protein